MPAKSLGLEPETPELRKNGAIVGITDRVYALNGGDVEEVLFDDVLVRGDLSGRLDYNGRKIEIVAIDTAVGLELDRGGVRGPVWKKVRARIVE